MKVSIIFFDKLWIHFPCGEFYRKGGTGWTIDHKPSLYWTLIFWIQFIWFTKDHEYKSGKWIKFLRSYY